MIETLKREDLSSYKNLIDECFGSSNALEKYENYRQNRGYTIFVVKDSGKIIATATQYVIDLFTFNFQPCVMIFNVAVKAEYREKGIAKKLLLHIIESAKTNGYHSVSLTCLENAHQAHKLYESVGFKKAGSMKFDLYL